MTAIPAVKLNRVSKLLASAVSYLAYVLGDRSARTKIKGTLPGRTGAKRDLGTKQLHARILRMPHVA